MVNSIAILNEERFLARSNYQSDLFCFGLFLLCNFIFILKLVGWGKDSINQHNQQAQHTHQNSYGVNYEGGGQNVVSVKNQLITLISATRTLMRSKR